MQYNILSGALCEVSTVSGHKLIDFNDIYLLSDYNNTPVFNLNSYEILSIDFDFGHRIHLDRFEYKFISNDVSSSALASGINFYFKDESFDNYVSLGTFVDDNIFYTTMDTIFAPRYIRITHTLSNTYNMPTASGAVYGFRALNNDSIVDFGIDGNLTEDSVETARGSAPVIKTIPIFNSGTKKSSALINLEPTFLPIDDVMYISNSKDGPWIKALDPSNIISDITNFSSGYTTGLQYVNGPLRMTGVDDLNGEYATKFVSDYYLTRIFEKNNTYCRFIINNVGIGGRVSVDKTDITDTIEVRSSNVPPTPYMVIRELRNITPGGITNALLGYRDRWLNTQSIKEDSSWSFLSCSYYSAWKDYKVVFDQSTERWAGYAAHTTTHSYSTAELYLFNNVRTESSKTYRLSYQSTAATPVNFVWRELKLDVTGGMWIYFYCQSYHSGDFVNATGYFLAYFDVNLSNTFKWFTVTEEIGKIDVDYSSKYVWYTRLITDAIYKVDVNGDIKVNFIDEDVTYDLGGIAVMPDGNLMFANGKDLHRLKYNGIYLSEYFMEGVVETKIDYISLDGDGSEAIWTIEGMTVGRLFITGERKGTYDFKVTLDYPTRMIAVMDGVWVTCSEMDGQGGVAMRFVSKINRRVDVEYRPSYVSSPGLLYQPYTHSNYALKLPVNIDTVWSSLPWKKVAINGFLTSEDRYYQLRIVLRRQEPIERYPEFVTDPNQEFISNDSFDQTSTVPNGLIWGDWLYYPSLNRVSINTINKNLVLSPDPTSSQNSYINTKNKFIVSRDVNGDLDIRIRYTVGAGNGVASGKSETVYLIAYSASPGYSGKYIGARLEIPADTSSYIRVFAGYNDNWTWNTNWTGLNMYEHDLRLYWNGSTVYAQWKNISDSNFTTGGSYNVASGVVGNHFYIQISSNKSGSQVKIDNFEIYNGDVYYYTESPQITSIHKQELLEVEDIYPDNYKDVYVKTYVPKDLEIGASYDMDMKVRWRIPI